MLRAAPLLLLLLGGCSWSFPVVNVDLSHEVNVNSTHWPGTRAFTRTHHHYPELRENGVWVESFDFCTSEHLSTHMDAPSHFNKDGWTLSDIPVDRLMNGKGVVVDIREKVKNDSNAQMTAEDLTAWIDKHGPLPDGAVVFVLTGWGVKYGNDTEYFGIKGNDTSNLSFPGIHESAAKFLAEYKNNTGRQVFGVGLDVASLDHGPTKTFPTHVILAAANIWGLEHMANLDKLPPKDFDVIAMPVKMTGGSGSPTRVVARITQRPQDVSAFIL